MERISRKEEKEYFGIYYIMCLNTKKIYIGQTRESFYRRWIFHKWNLKNGIHNNKHLQNAYNKYGNESFEFGVLEKFPVSEKDIVTKDILSKREMWWISYYNSHKDGYNLTDGGETQDGKNVPEASRKRVGEMNRKRMIGTKLSKETKDKMSLAHKGLVKSDEHRRHLSDSLTGKPKTEKHKQNCRIANQGSKQKTAKYTEKIIENIRLDYMAGKSVTQLAQEYKINRGTMYGLANNLRWKHVIPTGYLEFIESKKRKHDNSVPSLG